jgi:signal transduction histidine kinase
VRIGIRGDRCKRFRISIADTGIGMAPREIPKALEAFSEIDTALNRKHEGTGLGLPLTKKLIELHGGMLSLASTPGVGKVLGVSR